MTPGSPAYSSNAPARSASDGDAPGGPSVPAVAPPPTLSLQPAAMQVICFAARDASVAPRPLVASAATMRLTTSSAPM